MKSEQSKQIDQLFHSALECEPGERAAFLEQACEGDSKLRERIEDLISAQDEANSFIETPTIEVEPRMLAAEQIKRPAGDSIVGQTIAHYRIVAPLGSGGMGEVYLAQDTALGRRIALKLLPAVYTEDHNRVRRFEQEARTASALNHPNIVTIYEIGHTESQHFIASEFIDGPTLRQYMTNRHLKLNEALDVSIQIASALTAAHAKGIVHRDIKPENIMVLKDSFAAHEKIIKVLDFGIAKLIERPTSTIDPNGTTRMLIKTEEGVAIGTVSYMSPEQVRGAPVDRRTDIWSLGVVLYEMLTGELPFKGESTADTMAAILKEEPEEFAETTVKINPTLKKIVRRCLAREPERRFQTASDLGFALESLSGLPGADKAEVGHTSVMLGRANRTRMAWWVAAAFVIIAALAIVLVPRYLGSTSRLATFTSVTYQPMAIFKAAFAPDGKTIVFSGAPEGNTPRLFVIRPEYPEPQPLGDPGTHLLSVSSKGELAVLTGARYIAQRSFTGTLGRMPLGSGAPREILDQVREADWTPDASQLAIIHEVSGKDRLEFPIGNVLFETSGWVGDLRFSPKGDRIAFFEHPWRWDDRGSVNVVDLHGKRTKLSDGYWGEEGIAWDREGREILYSASLSGIGLSIYAVTLSGERRVALQSAGGQMIHDVSSAGRWLTSRDDQPFRVMVHSPAWEGDRDLSWLDASNFPTLSQDGRILVFMEQNSAMGPNYAVCLRKTEGGDVVRLGAGIPLDLSPDGRKVLAIVPSTPPQIVIYPTGAGDPLRLDRNGLENYGGDGRWFPDGESVLLGGNEPGKAQRYYVQNIAGGPPRAVTPEGTREGVLAPNGTFVLARGPDNQYHIYPLSGGEPRVVPGLTDDDRLVRLSADGRSVLASRHSEVPLHVERIDLESGRRSLFMEIAPADRVGLREIFLNFVSNDERSYAYWTSWFRSTLFTVEWGR